MFWKKKNNHYTDEDYANSPIIGYWCVPTSGQYVRSFMKLVVKDSYSLGGRIRLEVMAEPANAALAIVANAKILAECFSWLPELLVEIKRSLGQDAFRAEGIPANRALALDNIFRVALANGWVCVLQDPKDPANTDILANGIVDYARELFLDLTGKVRQHPPNIRIKTPITTEALNRLLKQWRLDPETFELTFDPSNPAAAGLRESTYTPDFNA